jgi:hypothetical protein
MITINQKITGWSLVKPNEPEAAPPPAPVAEQEQMHEKLKRPETLPGSTYKIRTPLSEHALYVTINDVVLNPGTEHEHRRPFEIFINSKNMDHFQWTVALTRIISAVFRKGGNVAFLVDELCSVYDPRGGYLRKGGYVPSLVAEIGLVIKGHLRGLGLIEDDALLLSEKVEKPEAGQDIPGADHCPSCTAKTMIKLDGCMTCLTCGNSKCG